jgi:uncharacterized membrane protein YqaE (UPF0057 family)
MEENTSIELAVALMLKGMAYMLCILVCAMFLPFIVSLIGVTFVKSSHWMKLSLHCLSFSQ